MALGQKSWIKILRAVAERIEGKHEHDQQQERPEIIEYVLTEPALRVSRYLALQPRWRFVDFGANVDHEKRRQRADDEHSAPTYEAEHRSVNQGRDQVANRVAFLQQAGEKSAPFRRQSFKRQGCAYTPLPAHCDSEQCPRNQKNFQRRSKSGSKFEHGVSNDVHHQSNAATVAVGHHTEQESADGAERQGDKDGFSNS